jgi:hypothetical protein
MPDQTNPGRLVHVVEDKQRRVRAQVWESWAQDGKVHHSITTSGYQNGWIQGVVHNPEQFMAAFDCAIAAERWVTNRRQELSRHMVDGRATPDCSLHEAPPSVSVLGSEKPQRGPDTDRGSEMNENYLKDKQGRPLTVRFDGQDHWVRVERYAQGNRPALLLVPKASSEEYIVVTVNPERGQAPRSGELLIKNYSENSEVSSKPWSPRASSSGPAGRSRPGTPRSMWCARSSRFSENARSTTAQATNERRTRLVHGNTGPDTQWTSLPA